MIKGAIAAFLISVPLASAQTASIKVDTSRIENHVSPRMYAAFVEMMAEGVKRGMTAELVLDRSFEEYPNYLGLPADWRLEPDERNDNIGAIRFEQTTDESYPKTNQATGAPEHALRVTLASEGMAQSIRDMRQGFSQGRISIRAGESYTGYVWIKVPERNAYIGDVMVGLEEDDTNGETYALAVLSVEGHGDWRQYSFALLPNKTDRFAKLTFLFSGKGTLYMDQVSLKPADAINDIRADSAAIIAELRPSFIRWPGGNVAQDYHWQWGIGPRDLRPVWINRAWSNAPEPNDLGTDEFLALCARVHAQPSITVNVNGAGATSEEAAAWVEYVNGSPTSKYGALRAANGHRDPYSVKQWELGNEIYGEWVRGHTDADTYAHAVLQYADAMRAVDPTIKLIAVGGGDEWNSAVLRIAGRVIDYIAIHDYTSLAQDATASNPRAQMMGRAGEFEASFRHTGELAAKLVPGRSIKLIVNEWNLFYPADIIESMEGAVYASRMMNGFERGGDVVDANCISDLLNGWLGGVIQASRDRVYRTPQFYAIKMYNDHLGTERLYAEVSSPKLQSEVNSLDAVVTRSPDGSKVFVKMSNADKQHAIKSIVDLGAFAYAEDVKATILSSTDSKKRNTFNDPDAVKPVDKTLRCSGVCACELPADSVAVLTFRKEMGSRN